MSLLCAKPGVVSAFRLGEEVDNQQVKQANVSCIRCRLRLVRRPANAKWRGSGAGAVWDKAVMESFSEEVALEQKCRGGEGVSHVAVW